MVHSIAVIGLGSIGKRHVENLCRLGVSACAYDPDPTAQRVAQGLGVKLYRSRDAAMAEAEAVIIASPSQYHLSDMEMALSHGCHVLCEKPLAHVLTEECETLPERFDAAGLVLACGFNLRFNSAVVRAKKWIAEGELGEPLWARFIQSSYLPDWRPGTDYRKNYTADPRSGGVIFDVIHELDLALYLLGSARLETAAARNSGFLEIDSEDIADLVLRHDSGLMSSVHLDYVTRPAVRIADIAGSKGRLSISIPDRTFTAFDIDGSVRVDSIEDGNNDDDYLAEMKNFVAAFRDKETVVADGYAGIDALRIAVAARRQCKLPEVLS